MQTKHAFIIAVAIVIAGFIPVAHKEWEKAQARSEAEQLAKHMEAVGEVKETMRLLEGLTKPHNIKAGSDGYVSSAIEASRSLRSFVSQYPNHRLSKHHLPKLIVLLDQSASSPTPETIAGVSWGVQNVTKLSLF